MTRSPNADFAVRLVEAALLTSLGALVMLMLMRPIWDIDIFWHIAAGRWMWEHGAIPSTDIFGLVPDREWVPFQWGYQVMVFAIDRAGGLRALRFTHAIVMALAFGLLYRTYRAHLTPRRAFPGAAIVLWLFTILLFQDRINVRPHVFNLLGLTIILPLLLGQWRDLSTSQMVGYVCVFAVWANLHAGGCLIMLVALAAVPAAALYEPGRPAARSALKLWAACALVAGCSPRFASGNLAALTLVNTTGGSIGEWSAPIAYLFEIEDPALGRIVAGLVPYLTALALGGLAVTGQLREREPTQLFAAVALTTLSLLYARFVYYAGPVWVIMAAWYLPPLRQRSGTLSRSLCTGLSLAAVVTMLWTVNLSQLFGGLQQTIKAAQRTELDRRRFPIAASEYLELVGFEGTIFCHARYGGYLLWKLHPRIRTIIDGRSNVDIDLAEEILFVHRHRVEQLGQPEIAARIASIYDTYKTDALVLERPVFAPQYLDCRRWVPVFRTSVQSVFFRNDQANARNLERVGLTVGDETPCSAIRPLR